ncbi:MAG: penicillin-binding protein 1B [Gammaproteobacteria bacterium]|nr:penicillin-binding protein 1B [Gammaproteobacteria bacterium]NIU41464.1 penicillin-binding protein 1B [Gammaproteobacteria bacterium]NIV49184.1 penicillin-binding protein 1B [Gammaproteobacteria bacterium]NIY00668.1 penicillin-binding protein 1B [Gammaproteobacteria bacterium]
MPSKTRRRSAASRSRKTRRRRHGRSVGGVLGRVMVIALILTGAYVAWLDLHVRSQFEGRRFSVPARLYARPLELYAGMRLTPAALEETLRAAGYQARADSGRRATYARRGETFDVHTRPFPFWDARQPALRVRVRFGAGQVSGVQVDGRERPLVRLDPALIGRIYPGHHEDRLLVRLDEVPSGLVAALLSVEDRDFEHHYGISPRAIARALFANLRAGALVQGGSTITQQLAKEYFLNGQRTWGRKLNDAVIALILEARYDKAEILEAYLNEVYLGQDGERAIHGFGLAAHFYFGRDLDALRLPELALLVALVRGPSYYNPRRHPRRALARRNLVLEQMRALGIISAARLERARAAPLGVIAATRARFRYPAFIDLVRRQLRRDYRDEDLRGDGLRIFTTLDVHTQRMAERALERRIARLEHAGGRRSGALQGAVIVTSPQSGEVLAVVGGRDEQRAGFNRAIDAVRPVGSLIKPAVYLAALEQPRRYTLASPLLDEPVAVRASTGSVWRPKNYDDTAHGRTSLYEALVKSYNLATVRLGMEVGLDEVTESLRRLGIERPLQPFPSLLLGAAELSPVEVTQMYQTLAGGGFRVPVRAIREVTSARGEPLSRYPLSVRQAFEPAPVFVLVEAMRGVMSEGTGRSSRARLGAGVAAAGKTGTTDGLRDSWFAGFTEDRLAVVWLGHDDNTPAGLSGADGALQVWIDMMKSLKPRSLAARAPSDVEWAWTDLRQGRTTRSECPGSVRFPYVRGSQPPVGQCGEWRAERVGAVPG